MLVILINLLPTFKSYISQVLIMTVQRQVQQILYVRNL